METRNVHGSCQCGAVKFEAEINLAGGTTKCNCTSCWKRRWWSVKAKPENFRALAGDDKLDQEKGFCRGCGIIPYRRVEAAEWNDGAYVSVNVAVLDDLPPEVLVAAPLQVCDGRNDDWWHEPKYKAHL